MEDFVPGEGMAWAARSEARVRWQRGTVDVNDYQTLESCYRWLKFIHFVDLTKLNSFSWIQMSMRLNCYCVEFYYLPYGATQTTLLNNDF